MSGTDLVLFLNILEVSKQGCKAHVITTATPITRKTKGRAKASEPSYGTINIWSAACTLQRKFPEHLETFVTAILADFLHIHPETGIGTVRIPREILLNGKDIHPYAFPGRSANFEKFLIARKRLQTKWLLSHPFLKKVRNFCLERLPCSLIKFSFDSQHFNIIIEHLNTNIEQSYRKIMNNINSELLNDKMKQEIYYKASNGILSIYLSQIFINTIEYLISTTSNPIVINAIFHDRVNMEPSTIQICNQYIGCLDNMFKISKKNRPFFIYLPLELINNYKHVLSDRLQKNYQPIQEHITLLNKWYNEIGNEIFLLSRKELPENTNDISIEKGLNLYEKYRKYYCELMKMPDIETFDMAVLNQHLFKFSLQHTIENVLDILIKKMSLGHQWEAEDICETIWILQLKTVKKPETSDELVELGEYINWAKNSPEVLNLKNRVSNLTDIMIKLLQLTELTQEHIDGVMKAINLYEKMQATLEDNSAKYDHYKFEFEEQLQRNTEIFMETINNYWPSLDIVNRMDNINLVKTYLPFLTKCIKEINEFKKEVEAINKEEALYKFPLTTFLELDKQKEHLFSFFILIKLCIKWHRRYHVWMDGSFNDLKYNRVVDEVDEFLSTFEQVAKEYKEKIHKEVSDNLPKRFTGFVDDPDPLNHPAPLRVCAMAIWQINDFRKCYKTIKILCNESLLDRHWKHISDITGFDMTPSCRTTLRKIIDMELEDKMDQFEIISLAAEKEQKVYKTLLEMQSEWELLEFKTSRSSDLEVDVLTGLDDIQIIVDDHVGRSLALRSSAFVKPYEEQVRLWLDKINAVNEILDRWKQVQFLWLYLLPLFSSKRIAKDIGDDSLLFESVNETLHSCIRFIQKQSKIIEITKSKNILNEFNNCMEHLERISHAVDIYLEKKRQLFPRLYFLADHEIITILSETKNAKGIQPYLSKIFEGVFSLQFNEKPHVAEISSREGESILLSSSVDTNVANEIWLSRLEKEIICTLRQLLIESVKTFRYQSRIDWLLKWPNQITVTTLKIMWTEFFESTLISRDTLEEYKVKHLKNINDLTELLNKASLTHLERSQLKSVLISDIYELYIIRKLHKLKIHSITDFNWMIQFRYKIINNECVLQILHETIRYSYEYMGKGREYVLTPISEKLYFNLISCFSKNCIVLLEGEAGTGKSATFKSLAYAVAKHSVSFDCFSHLNYKVLKNLLKGMALSGAWLYCNNFDKVNPELVSVIAQFLHQVLIARSRDLKVLNEGINLTLNPDCFLCITHKRGKLKWKDMPENFRSSFRTVTVATPEYGIIVAVYLRACGFRDFQGISSKLLLFFRLCTEQFSIQNHYGFGLRPIKACLALCAHKKSHNPRKDETAILLDSIAEVTHSQIGSHDRLILEHILHDIFPNMSVSLPDDLFMKRLKESCIERYLQETDYFCDAVLGIYRISKVRNAVAVLGEPYSGKTSTIHVLMDILSRSEGRIEYEYVHQKSITLEQLYGHLDESSDWRDGIFTKYLRQLSSSESCFKWIIFDGSVDETWMENLYSLLDFEKKLYLSSGEILDASENISFIFETADLLHATPSIISRLGVVYIREINWQQLIRSWISNNKLKNWLDANEEFLINLFEWIIPLCIELIKEYTDNLISRTENELVRTFLVLMEILLDDAYKEYGNREDTNRNVAYWIQSTLLFAALWGFSGTLTTDAKRKFECRYKDVWKLESEEKLVLKVETVLPTNGNWYHYFYSYKGRGKWIFLPEYLRDKKIEIYDNVHQALMPCVDSYIHLQLLITHIRYRYPVLLTGACGTGKSFCIQDIIMENLDQEKYDPSSIALTEKMSANRFQKLILSKLNRKEGGLYIPTRGKLSVMFIDDLNVPEKDASGVQAPLELLRQYLDRRNWYDLKNATPIHLRNIIFVAATRALKNKQDIYSRLLRHFSVYGLNDSSHDGILQIYNNILLLEYKTNGFSNDILSTVQQIVSATLKVYDFLREHFKPKLITPHYKFDLRDFSRLILGCARLKKESADNKSVFVKLWVHETLRVFADRLIDESDQFLLHERIKHVVEETFHENFDSIFENLIGSVEVDLQNLVFCAHLNKSDNRYEEVVNIKLLYELTAAHLEKYNAHHKIKLDLVLFASSLRHLSRICRILSMPCGNCLLIGTSGSGRHSLSKLATFIIEYTLKQLTPKIDYGTVNWRDDLKEILKLTGAYKQNIVFVLSQNQLIDTFMEDIDLLLNTGEIPGVFQVYENQEILAALRDRTGNLDESTVNLFNIFKQSCREHLHFVICLTNFHQLINTYPSLTNNCTIDWFEEWPREALLMIGDELLIEVNIPEEIREKVIATCVYFHNSAKALAKRISFTEFPLHVTPASYLNLMRLYRKLILEKQEMLFETKNRFESGLRVLDLAKERGKEMEEALEEYKPQLRVFTENAIRMNREIAEENSQVEKASELVRADEQIANAQAAEARRLKSECEAELAQAIPILEDAISSLNTLKPTDITLVKSMKNPPDAIKLVMAAVCVMKGVKPDRNPDPATGKRTLDYWGPSKRVLSDMAFLQQLKEYDKDDIKPEIMYKIRTEYISNKDFKPHIVANASGAAEGLCKWVIAMDKYDAVAKEVAPKKEKLESAELRYAATAKILKEKKDQLAILEKRLANLNVNLAKATERQRFLQNSVDLCETKLSLAEKLITGLSIERDRWIIGMQNLQVQYVNLYGDMLISCGVIAYLGGFTIQHRPKTVQSWYCYVCETCIPSTLSYNFISSFNSIQFHSPLDDFTIENSIIIKHSTRHCLLIDTQLEGRVWIKKLERLNDLIITSFSKNDWFDRLKISIKNGQPILIEGVKENINPILNPILYKHTYTENNSIYINLDGNQLVYNKHFRLYLANQEVQPTFTAETLNKVTVINFRVTTKTLRDAILKTIVKIENPELYRDWKKAYLNACNQENRIENNSKKILDTLTGTEHILDKEKVIEDLCFLCNLYESMREDMQSSLRDFKQLESSKSDYNSLAECASIQFYCISLLCNLNPMYRYSSGWFINLLNFSIDDAKRSRIITTRLQLLKNHFTEALHTHISISLYRKHRIAFSFLFYVITSNIASREELQFMFTKNEYKEKKIINPTDWLNDRVWEEILRLSKVKAFLGLDESVATESLMWKGVHELSDLNDLRLSGKWKDRLSEFQKLMIIKALRIDDFYEQVKCFLVKEMGTEYVYDPVFDFEKSYARSSKAIPLLFLLSPNNDPTQDLAEFAEMHRMENKLKIVSLGQNYDCIRESIEQARLNGWWICLQNCHIVSSCLSTLEKIYVNLNTPSTHPNFRLWLTSYSVPSFPVTVVQNSIKMTKEQPVGFRESMLKSYSIINPLNNPKIFRGSLKNEPIFFKLLYALAFFHSKILGRKRFGPIGWTVPYNFSDRDFTLSVRQLSTIISEYPNNILEAISYSIMECNYGVHVLNEWDFRLLECIFLDLVSYETCENANYGILNSATSYKYPKQAQYQVHVNHIKEFPKRSSPELFGLHGNVQFEQNSRETKKFRKTIEAILCTSYPTEFEVDINKVETLLSTLPKEIEFKDSFELILKQELTRYLSLLHKIRTDLTNLLKTYRGNKIFDSDLEMLGKNLYFNKIPSEWLQISYPSSKGLSSYIEDFVRKFSFFEKWVNEGRPDRFWLSAFFSIRAFVTDVKLEKARKLNVSYDLITFDFEKDEGCDVYGLFIDGARWNRDKNALDELLAKQYYDRMPIIRFSPILSADLEIGTRYISPLYRTIRRDSEAINKGIISEYVPSILLNTNVDKNHWIQRGVALICEIDL